MLRCVLALCCIPSIVIWCFTVVLFPQVSLALLYLYRQYVHSVAMVANVWPLEIVSSLPIVCAAPLKFYCVFSRAFSCWFVWIMFPPPSPPIII